MKRHLLFLAFALAAFPTFAQLPDGSTAPDWTATDINGVEHNLQSYLDQGITVILEFSATWSGPDWNYHNSNILRDLYYTFGPDGTGDLMVFYMESDDNTTQADLEGIGTATVGDWITGTPYPIIDNMESVFLNDYGGAYYPTIYTICPDGILTESAQVDFDSHASIAFQDCENAITGPAPLMSYNGATLSCGGAAWPASTAVTNLGPENVTGVTFMVTLNGNSTVVNWTGVIATGATETVDLGQFTEVGDLNVAMLAVNTNTWEAYEDIAVIGSVESTTNIQVRITTDNWPGETGWVIADDAGNEVASLAVGSLAQNPNTLWTWDVDLPSTGCYTFTIFDTYGDGLHASQWGDYTDGTAGVYSMDGETEVGIVWEYDGASGIEFSEFSVGMQAGDGCTDESACNFMPLAIIDDGTCYYGSEYRDCSGNCLSDLNNDGICDVYETFERFDTTSGIATQSEYWDTWVPSADVLDAFVSEVSGNDGVLQKSLLIEGPTDVIFLIDHSGRVRFDFDLYIPSGKVGYYNIQENATVGMGWAIQSFFTSEQEIVWTIDGETTLTAEYPSDEWFTISHDIDPASNTNNIYFNHFLIGQLPYDADQIGSINFYPAPVSGGTASYFVDHLRFQTTSGPTPNVEGGCMNSAACNFSPNAGWDDGSCCYCPSGEVVLEGVWRLSPNPGAISVGTETDPAYYYYSDYLPLEQLDDEWTLTSDGLFIYDNGGASIYPFDGSYSPISSAFSNTTFSVEMNSGSLLNGTIHLGNQQVFNSPYIEGGTTTCGWMGVWDSGPDYEIIAINETELVLRSYGRSLTQDDPLGTCLPDDNVVFTLTFVRSESSEFAFCATGCTDSSAFNYDSEATEDDGSCFFASCQDVGSDEWSNMPFDYGIIVSSNDSIYVDTEATLDFVVYLGNSVEDPASGGIIEIEFWEFTLSGLPPGFESTMEEPFVVQAGEQICLSFTGIPAISGTFPVQVSGSLFTSIFGNNVAFANVGSEQVVEVFESTEISGGCTYPVASNFDPAADLDDGSCTFEPTSNPCPADLDGDGAVSTIDLLQFLSFYGDTCE